MTAFSDFTAAVNIGFPVIRRHGEQVVDKRTAVNDYHISDRYALNELKALIVGAPCFVFIRASVCNLFQTEKVILRRNGIYEVSAVFKCSKKFDFGYRGKNINKNIGTLVGKRHFKNTRNCILGSFV